MPVKVVSLSVKCSSSLKSVAMCFSYLWLQSTQNSTLPIISNLVNTLRLALQLSSILSVLCTWHAVSYIFPFCTSYSFSCLPLSFYPLPIRKYPLMNYNHLKKKGISSTKHHLSPFMLNVFFPRVTSESQYLVHPLAEFLSCIQAVVWLFTQLSTVPD